MDKIIAADRRLPVFVYGTLLTGYANHGWALAGCTDRVEDARVSGAQMFAGVSYPYAALTSSPGDVVVGEVHWPRAEVYDEVLTRLDALEGYRLGRTAGNHYIRTEVVARLADGAEQMAWMYTCANAARLYGLPRIEDGSWRGWMAWLDTQPRVTRLPRRAARR